MSPARVPARGEQRAGPAFPRSAAADRPLSPQHTRAAADAAAKGSLLPVAVCRAAAAPRMGLRPRAALGDIGNRVAEPRTRAAVKKAAMEGSYKPGTRLATPAKTMTTMRRKRRAATKKRVQPPAPERKPDPEPESSQVPPAVSLGPRGPFPALVCAPPVAELG